MMFWRLCLIMIMCLPLMNCTSLVVAGAAGGAVASNSDRRTTGTQIDDNTTKGRISIALNKIEDLEENADISVNVYNAQVLLTGQARTKELIDLATQTAANTINVDKVHNQIRLGEPIATAATINDIWLGTKIRTLMTTNKSVPLLKLDLIIEDSEVFIMGHLTKEEATAAVDLVRNVKGVKKVIRVMELVE